MEKLRGIYSAIYGEVNVSVSGDCELQYAGGTRASSCFISVTLKSWSGRKLLDPTTYFQTADDEMITEHEICVLIFSANFV